MGSNKFTEYCGFLYLVFFLSLSCLFRKGEAVIQRRIAVQFLSYINRQGRLTDGTCCDNMRKVNGDCEENRCDTAFSLCFRLSSAGSGCTSSFDTTAVENNNTVSRFGRRVGDTENATYSLIATPFMTMDDMDLQLTVFELDPGARHLLGNFSLHVNWTDPYTPSPDWHQYIFNNTVVSVSVNITSYCSKYFYGPSCSTFCKPADSTHGHFTCGNNGVKQCLTGWTGPACKTFIDHCLSGPCQNGATCKPLLNSLNCKCLSGFSGKLCEIKDPTTVSTVSTQMSSTPDDSSGLNIVVVLGSFAALVLIGALSVVGYIFYNRKTAVAPEEDETPDENVQVQKVDASPK